MPISSLRLSLTLLATVTLAGAAAGPAQEMPAAMDLSLEEALRRGFAVSEEIRLADSGVEEARAQVRSARSEALPQIDGTVAYTRTLATPYELPEGFGGEDGGGLPFGNDNTWIAALTVSQPLYTGGTLSSAIAISEHFLDAAEQVAAERSYDLALAVTEAYYDAVLASRLVAIAEAQAEQVEDQLELVRLREQAGNAARIDVLRAEVELANIEPELVAARNARSGAVRELKRLVNIPEETALRLVDRLSPEGFSPIAEALLAELADGAEERPVLRQAARQVAIAEEQIDIARAAYRPRVDLDATFAEQALPSSIAPALDEFRDDWSAGVNLRIPVFTGGRRAAEVAIAEERALQARLDLAQLEEAVLVEVRQSAAEVERAIALIEARAETVAQAAEVYRLSQLRYEQGITTFLELEDARLALRQARANEAQALHDYYLALARFLRAAGAPLAVSTLRLVQTPQAARASADEAPAPTGPGDAAVERGLPEDERP